jgi:16S rRNA (cytidine1402-2'-O)-methyltransferase
VVVGGAMARQSEPSEADLDALLCTALNSHHVKEAANLVAAQTGLAKRDVYARALVLRKGVTLP